MERLRKEVVSVVSDAAHPTREQIRRMPYLANVIKESLSNQSQRNTDLRHADLALPGLRLYPPVPLNNRTAMRTTILPTGGGPDGHSPILVRRGEVVVFSSYVNSRRKNIYGPDANDFRPERWETGELADVGWGYFPFNGGPRACLGQDFALMEVSYTLVRLLQEFPAISLPMGGVKEPIGTERQRLTLVLSSADGCKVELSRRR